MDYCAKCRGEILPPLTCPRCKELEAMFKDRVFAAKAAEAEVDIRGQRIVKLEAVAEAAKVLLDCLPDNGRTQSWGWAWNELGDDEQDEVKRVRAKAEEALKGLEG